MASLFKVLPVARGRSLSRGYILAVGAAAYVTTSHRTRWDTVEQREGGPSPQTRPETSELNEKLNKPGLGVPVWVCLNAGRTGRSLGLAGANRVR